MGRRRTLDLDLEPMVRDMVGLVLMEGWDPPMEALDRRTVGTAVWAHMAAWDHMVDTEAWEHMVVWEVDMVDMGWAEWV